MAFDVAFYYSSKMPINILTYVRIKWGYSVLNRSSKGIEMQFDFTHMNTAYVRFVLTAILTAIISFIHQ